MSRATKTLIVLVTIIVFGTAATAASATKLPGAKPGPKSPYLDTAGDVITAADTSSDTYAGPGNNNPQPGRHDNGRGGNTYVNDPCLDPPAPNRQRTVQSETEIATWGKYMVAGYNDSWGFYNNLQGLSGFAYSVNGGNTWVDGGGLPPVVKTGLPAGTPGQDAYFGDPVVVARQSTGDFWFSSLYMRPDEIFTLSVNRGRFMTAPPSTPESMSNTRCANGKVAHGVADTKNLPAERIVWGPPVQAVLPPFLGPNNFDFLDKEWLHVDELTGNLYMTYTRFGEDGSTPIELVRSFDGGATWTPPTVIVPNLLDTFNQATFPITVPLPGGGTRVIVYWWSRTFDIVNPPFPVTSRRIEYAISNDNGNTFGPVQVLDTTGSTGEPPGYNRLRTEILNGPFAHARGNTVSVTYIHGRSAPLTGAAGGPRPTDTAVQTSHDGGLTYGGRILVNDDAPGVNSHIFPSVQINKHGDIYVAWLDRRNDPDNILTETWANVSKDGGLTFGHDKLQSDVATSWFARADARPNFGDYNSSELLDDNQFLTIWADGRFPGAIDFRCAPGTGVACPPGVSPETTPDTIFTIAQGLGVGGG